MPYEFPDGLMTAIWVNENLFDLLVKPAAVGQPASVDMKPETSFYVVDSQVTTVAKGKATTLNVSEPSPGPIEISGQMPSANRRS